jgi:hypothetical protein
MQLTIITFVSLLAVAMAIPVNVPARIDGESDILHLKILETNHQPDITSRDAME